MNSNHLRKLIIAGASGHACVAAEAAEGTFAIVGFVSDGDDAGVTTCYGPWLGELNQLAEVLELHHEVSVHVGIGDNGARKRVASMLEARHPGLRFATLVHASASVSRTAVLEEGVLICAGAVVGPGARIGRHVIVNTGASVDHHACVGPFASLAPGARTGGGAVVGEGSAVGMGTVIHQGIKVGSDSVVGSMALVNRDLPDRVVAYGHPCRVVRGREPGERYL